MKRAMHKALFLLTTLLLLLGLTVGCAQDLPDIDRTQPRAVKKSLFRTRDADGSLREWFFRQTVIEVPYGTGATFVGEQGITEKIVWEITENMLYAFRTREYVQNTDKNGHRKGTGEFRGSAIAAFRIEKHFDIQRGYNPATGEQTNVIVENTLDRPWNERKHMRVDFSKNLIADFRFIASKAKTQAVGYYIPENDKNNKDRAKLGDQYIDVVHKIFMEPEVDDFLSKRLGRPIPSCWLYSSISKDCQGQTIKIRSSFMLAPKSKYLTKEYGQGRMAKFGYFRGVVYKYDRNYGILEKTTRRQIQRWNLWKDESSCVQKGQRLSHAKCTMKPIAYHVNHGFPTDLTKAAGEVFHQWNKIFREVVKTRSGRDQGDVFVFCPNNPVQKGDHALCGKEGTNPQIGDLRYNFLYWIPRPHRSSPLGYGPSAADPLTGEIVNANAFIYGAALDTYSAYATNLVRLLNGDLKPDELAQGQKLLTYIKNVSTLQKNSALHWHKDHLHTKLNPKLVQGFQRRAKLLQERVKSGAANFDYVAANLKKLSDHPNNSAVLGSDDIFKSFNLQFFSPSGQVTQQTTQLFGPQRLANASFFDWTQKRLERLSKRNVMMADFLDDGILARAQKMKERFRGADGKVDYIKVHAQIRKDVFLAVALHEVGHNLGLRHNFAASADALNYHDHYWKLRADTIPDGSKAPLPMYRYTQKSAQKLQNAIQKGLHEFQYSSIMDYGAGFASDLHGLGKYDRAAILYGYGDIVEVFKKNSTVLTASNAKKELAQDQWHYTQLPRVIAGSDKPFTQQIQSLKTSARRLVTLNELKKDSSLIQVPYRFCSDEYHFGAADCARFDQGADYYERVKDLSQRYFSYYVINAFKRGRLEFGTNVKSYLGRISGRYFEPIAHQYKHFVNDALVSGKFGKCGGTNNWYTDPRCGENAFVASITALNFFARVIQTPDIGCYKKQTDKLDRTRYKHVSSEPCKPQDKGVTIPLGVGRQMLSSFDKDTHGYEFYWKPNNYGAWWDKYLAVKALGNPYTRFLGVDRAGNTRSFLINFSNLFGRYVNNIVGGFLAERSEMYSPLMTLGGKVQYRDPIKIGGPQIINPLPAYQFTTPIDPDEQYTAKLMIGFLAAVYFSNDTDNQSLNESMKISVRGLSESPDVPDSIRKDPARYVEVVDPGSNRIYYATKVENQNLTFNAGPKQFSIGFEILKDIKNRYFESDGITLKFGVSKADATRAFHYIKVMMGWLRVGEYNRPRGL